MAQKCEITGVGPMSGHRVSHSNIKTKIRNMPNIKKCRIWDAEKNCWVTLKITVRALRTINKNGLNAVMCKKAAKR